MTLTTLASDTRYLILILVSFSFLLPTMIFVNVDLIQNSSDVEPHGNSAQFSITKKIIIAITCLVFIISLAPVPLGINTTYLKNEIDLIDMLRKENKKSLAFATDTQFYNPNTARLADFIASYSSDIQYTPLVFSCPGHCPMQGKSLDECKKIILESDAVFFDKDADTREIFNQYVPGYYEAILNSNYKRIYFKGVENSDLYFKQK